MAALRDVVTREAPAFRQYAAQENLIVFARRMYPVYRAAEHHWRIATALQAIERGEIDRLCITMPPRHGKALALDTPIPVPSGWTTIGDLRPGDNVFGADGRTCRVVAVSPVWRNRPLYRVRTKEGAEIVADGEHEWRVSNEGRRGVFLIRTTEFLARPRQKQAMIQRAAPLQLPDDELPIEPYTLGVWLGDGCSHHATVTADDADAGHIRSRIEAEGYPTSERATVKTFGVLGLNNPLRRLGLLGDKCIPSAYLRASEGQRRTLLQGLIDTDGYVAHDGQVGFCSTNQALADGVAELVASLGGKASVVPGRAMLNGTDHGAKFRVMFYLAGAASLPRKAERCRDGVKTPNHYAWAEPAGRGDTVCIQVDSPDHLFLAGRAMIPTHNSELASVMFPAWYIGRNPDKRIILCSYGDTLARRFSRRARNMLLDDRSPFPAIRPAHDSSAVNEWDIEDHRGGVTAAGVGAGITGKGADLLLIDDPVKSAREADSETFREHTWEWFTNDAYTRLEDGAAIVVIGTRWHEADLIGRALALPEGWIELNLPAIAEAGDPLGRMPGEALWPEKYDETALAQIKRTIGSRAWVSLYQQRPSPAEGGILKRHWWRFWHYPGQPLPPVHTRMPDGSLHEAPCVPLPSFWDEQLQSWDLAFKDTAGSDYVCGQVWGAWQADRYLLDQTLARIDFPATLNAIREVSEHWPHARRKLVEDKANGPAVIATLRHEIAGLVPVDPEGGKVARANAAAPQIESGNVYLPHPRVAPWVDAFIEECASFPTGRHDDQVDSMTQALNRLDAGSSSETIVTSYMDGGDDEDEERARW